MCLLAALCPRPQTPINRVELRQNKFSQNARHFSVTSFLAASFFNEDRGRLEFDPSITARDDTAAKAGPRKTASGGRRRRADFSCRGGKDAVCFVGCTLSAMCRGVCSHRLAALISSPRRGGFIKASASTRRSVERRM